MEVANVDQAQVWSVSNLLHWRLVGTLLGKLKSWSLDDALELRLIFENTAGDWFLMFYASFIASSMP